MSLNKTVLLRSGQYYMLFLHMRNLFDSEEQNDIGLDSFLGNIVCLMLYQRIFPHIMDAWYNSSKCTGVKHYVMKMQVIV